jgi:V8-like Glu-specific endopeptidase
MSNTLNLIFLEGDFMTKTIVAAFAIWMSLPGTANAFPLPRPGDVAPLGAGVADGYDFEGIVRLSNCSGSFIRLENAKDNDPGLVLTNGHCLETGMPKPGQVMQHQPSARRFSLYNKAAEVVGVVTAQEVVYSSMTKTDITLYKLNETYAQVQTRLGIHPFTLASTHPVVSTPIQVISGYWVKGYSCSIEAFAYQLHEDDWTFVDSVRYSRPGCNIIGGTSGSPVIQTGTRNVVAINNTINEDGQQCTMNNPCEVDTTGKVFYQEGIGYAQETYWIYSCLNANGDFDTSVKGCTLAH